MEIMLFKIFGYFPQKPLTTVKLKVRMLAQLIIKHSTTRMRRQKRVLVARRPVDGGSTTILIIGIAKIVIENKSRIYAGALINYNSETQ